LATAISSYTRSTTTTKEDQIRELNRKVNGIVDFCMNSLPNGIPECDNRLKVIMNEVCSTSINNNLDACHNGRVDQYYRVRGEVKMTGNKTSQ
jgi:hypothetical protein